VRCPAGQTTSEYHAAEKVRADISWWPRPSARPAGCARNACGGKGRAPLRSRQKKACSRQRAPTTQRRRDGRVCGNEWCGASDRALGAVGDSPKPIFGENQDPPAGGDGRGGGWLWLGQAAGSARGNSQHRGCQRRKNWPSGRPFSPVLHSPRARMGVTGDVRTPPRISSGRYKRFNGTNRFYNPQ